MDPGTGAEGMELSWGFGLRHWTRQKGGEQCKTLQWHRDYNVLVL